MSNYVIKELRLNDDKKLEHPSCDTFDVLIDYEGNVKWISFHYDDFFPWAVNDSSNLQAYILKKKFKTWAEAIKDLSELEYNWNTHILRFLDANYRKEIFHTLPKYNPDPFADDYTEDEDEDE